MIKNLNMQQQNNPLYVYKAWLNRMSAIYRILDKFPSRNAQTRFEETWIFFFSSKTKRRNKRLARQVIEVTFKSSSKSIAKVAFPDIKHICSDNLSFFFNVVTASLIF